MAQMNIATDKDDYQPGEVVYITASDIKPGGTAYFTLAHLIDPGTDGVSGTKDDAVAYDLAGTGSWAVVDGGAGDLDGLANGVIVTSWNVSDDAAYQQFYLSAERVLPNGKLSEPAITTFTDVPQPPQSGSIAWEKRTEAGALQGGATFEISPDPSDGVGVMTVVDNGANDADPDAGQILVQNVPLGTYTITETVAPAGYALDDDPTRSVTVSADDLNAVIGSPLGAPPGTDDLGNTDESDFHNIPIPPQQGNGATPGFWKAHVDIVNEELGEFQTGLTANSSYETVFGVTLNGASSFNPTLLEALEAKGTGTTGAGGQGALLRHSTAAFIAAASDAVDEDGAGPQDNLNFSFAGLSANPSYNLLLLIDLNDDLKLSPDEVINAVQDVYNDADADTSFLGEAGQPGKQALADAFAAMNNQPHLDPSQF